MSLEVTKAEFFPVNSKKSSTKAFAQVTFNKTLTVKGFKIVEGDDGLFVGFPSEQSKKDDKWYNTVLVSSKGARSALCDEIMSLYEEFLEEDDSPKKKKKRRDDDDDEKPRKKSKRDDDDDDDEKPKKKKRDDDDDDDDEDEKPRKSKKRSRDDDDDDENLFD